ncbi:uncharacterized protein UTRI_00562_B [Ustilago trichophora]|uniref:Uncharacterized protein n=1 Tax=Ustilago trichophora TaxID=86804 RepID=A0A5C3DT49_9BASI|nr:uncharacterized protein UTRI_00562_B [Ustilago trichophora]
MSITDTMQSTAAPPSKLAIAKSSQPRRNRIRRGQKLDEVVSLSEQRLSPFSSQGKGSVSQSATPSTSSSSASSSAPGASGPSSSSSAAAGGESPFQLQEYLAMLVRRDPHNVKSITSLPTEADIESLTSSADKGKEPEDDAIFQNVDTDIWVYEQLRRLVLDLTTPWLTSLQQECDKHLRPATCAAMNAGDWMYLCASHGEEKQCCAIDYMVHTLDGATSLLNSARHFPSRTYVPNTSLRHFGSIARRLSRIFVHAWCYHKDTFLACEAETSLYSRFYVLVETYDLTATDNLPPRPGHGDSGASATAYDVDEAEFSRGTGSTNTPAFTLNGTTAKRERSGTAAPRSLLSKTLQQPQSQPQEPVVSAAAAEVDAVGLVPPPAPSPRPTAILSRPDHEEGDDDAPAWTSFPSHANAEKAGSSFLPTENDEDEEDEDEDQDEEESGSGGDDATQKMSGLKSDMEDNDATISLRAVDFPAALAAANGGAKAEKEDDAAVAVGESVKVEKAEDAKLGGDEATTLS